MNARNPKPEKRGIDDSFGFRAWDFILVSGFGFRVSDFQRYSYATVPTE
jgi:hypothetical protein